MFNKNHKKKSNKNLAVKEEMPIYKLFPKTKSLSIIDFQPSNYLREILVVSEPYLKQEFQPDELNKFIQRIKYIEKLRDTDVVIKEFTKQYIGFVKEKHQRSYSHFRIKL